MRALLMKLLALVLASGLYWQLVCEVTGAQEPWDSDGYWTLWYPISLALAAVVGYFLSSHGWLAGVIITFSQLPVMWINAGTGPLLAAGLLFLCILAVPAAAVSFIAGRVAMRTRTS